MVVTMCGRKPTRETVQGVHILPSEGSIGWWVLDYGVLLVGISITVKDRPCVRVNTSAVALIWQCQSMHRRHVIYSWTITLGKKPSAHAALEQKKKNDFFCAINQGKMERHCPIWVPGVDRLAPICHRPQNIKQLRSPCDPPCAELSGLSRSQAIGPGQGRCVSSHTVSSRSRSCRNISYNVWRGASLRLSVCYPSVP